ncbi:hypothetical protein Y032_0007g3236 [Ancylostoma ceylanicum]|uniref:Uncharacterized protein n=1 Tax=Ancylostoma ceylanicum TaxID=53326 RepID=A0A016VLI4_9BILA|nr:hypothetical protein Y032_0007g3236 [Ancylostoma ceylanicum]
MFYTSDHSTTEIMLWSMFILHRRTTDVVAGAFESYRAFNMLSTVRGINLIGCVVPINALLTLSPFEGSVSVAYSRVHARKNDSWQ